MEYKNINEKDLLTLGINDMAGIDFECSCGKHHTLDISKIAIYSGAINKIVEFSEPFKSTPIYIISDNNTYAVAGKKVNELLNDNKFDVHSFVFEKGNEMLIPDEKALGRIFMEMPKGTGLIIAVGSGTLNDLAKYVSSRSGVPYIIVCTAPSMDGYATGDSPMICEGYKISFHSTLAYGIVGDTDIMKDAPMRLIWAGFGDVLGKMTALAEWKMSRELTGEYFCQSVYDITQKAIDKACNKENAKGLANRDEKAILYLIEALILTGVAMGLIGVSRPASGAEHMMSHYWEMYYIAHNRFPEFHGIKVGIATPIIAGIFEELKDELPACVTDTLPSRLEIEEIMKLAGTPVYPTDIGIEKELFHETILNAYNVRKRYNILQYCIEHNKIEYFADEITKRIYG